ncbi:MAG: ABC transporter ATP-binding protein [Deltaproteobacteria bacterium]|nr:ABC transporter ATP-binding protein [Deltaproteobacteria bacterium]
MKLLEINNFTVWYESLFGDIRALDRCSLWIEQGNISCLLGINGAGKTTLFRAISGVISDFDGKITVGEILFNSKSLLKSKPYSIVSMGIGHAPQGRHIFYTLSVEDNLYLGAYPNRKEIDSKKKIEKEKDYVYDLFPVLKERRHQKAGTLSGGEQQMLSIGRALMSCPKLLLLDEPFLGLAPVIIEEILKSLKHLKEKGLTIFLAEQNAKAALSIADFGFVMDDGYIISQGDASQLSTSNVIQEIYFGENK